MLATILQIAGVGSGASQGDAEGKLENRNPNVGRTSRFDPSLISQNQSALLHPYAHRMYLEIKLRKVGNSVGIVLPKETLAHMNVSEGDVLCVTDAAEGCLRLSPAKPDFDRQMASAQDVIARYRNTLRELAK